MGLISTLGLRIHWFLCHVFCRQTFLGYHNRILNFTPNTFISDTLRQREKKRRTKCIFLEITYLMERNNVCSARLLYLCLEAGVLIWPFTFKNDYTSFFPFQPEDPTQWCSESNSIWILIAQNGMERRKKTVCEFIRYIGKREVVVRCTYIDNTL